MKRILASVWVTAGLWCIAATAMAQGTDDGALGPATKAATTTSQPVAPPLSPEQVGAFALRHSALNLIHAPANTPARAGRLVLLTRLAVELDPTDPDGLAILTDIYEIQGDYKAAEQLVTRRLKDNPDDYVLSLSYLRLRLAQLQTASDKLAFLQKFAADKNRDVYIRAQASAQAAEIYLGQGDNAKALAAFQDARRLDGLLPSAIKGVLGLTRNLSQAQRLALLLALVRADAADPEALWQAALLLNNVGQFQEAVSFYDAAYQLMQARGESPDEAFLVQYFNGLLDARQSRKAIEIFVPLLNKHKDSMEIKSLLREAFVTVGDDPKAANLAENIEQQLRNMEIPEEDPAATYRTMAWQYTINDLRPYTALACARTAAKGLPSNGALELVLGAAELRGGQEKAGLTRLKKLQKKDPYAAVFLAEHYYRANDPAAGKAALLDAAAQTRRGRAFRRATELATRQHVKLPEPGGTEDMRKQLKNFTSDTLAMGVTPQRFVRTYLRPAAPTAMPGEHIMLGALLSNESPYAIPLGPSGLLNANISLRAVPRRGQREEFDDLPMIDFKAPRYLAVEQNLQRWTLADVGNLDEYLMRRPLETIQLTFYGIVDPMQKGQVLVPSLPGLETDGVDVFRLDLLGQFDREKVSWPKRYQYSLGYLVKLMRADRIEARMVAARATASLLTFVGDLQVGRATVPPKLTGQVKQPVLLTLLREVLKDKSPYVRAEAVSSLIYCRVDNNILRILSAVQNDPSPLVRLRMAELVGVTQPAGYKKLIQQYQNDEDETVHAMAKLFK